MEKGLNENESICNLDELKGLICNNKMYGLARKTALENIKNEIVRAVRKLGLKDSIHLINFIDRQIEPIEPTNP